MSRNLNIPLAPERKIMAPPDEEVIEGPGIWSTLESAFRRENTAGAWLANVGTMGKEYDDVEGFNQWEGNEGTIFERHPRALIGVRSPAEKEDVRIKLERDEKDLETIYSSGMFGWISAMAAGFLDPIVLAGTFLGGAGTAAKLGKAAEEGIALSGPLIGGVRAARGAFAGTAITEAVLQSQQDARTWGETALNIGGATFLGGVLGAAAVGIDRKLMNLAIKDVERDLGSVVGGSDPAVARLTAAEVMEDSATGSQNMLIKLKKNFGVARTIAALKLSPFVSLMVKSRSNVLKQTLLDMVDAPCLVEGWTPRTSVFQHVEGHFAARTLLAEELDDRFIDYMERMTGEKLRGLTGKARMAMMDRFSGRDLNQLNRSEFRIEVSKALFSGDKHPVPEVQAMAESYRTKLFNPMLDRMMKTGRLPEDWPDFELIGAMSYLTRVYNKNNIIAYKEQFNGRIKNWLREVITDDEIDAITKKHVGLSHEEAIDLELDRATEDIFDNIVGHSDSRLLLDPIRPGKASPLKPRALTIKDEVIRAPIPDGEGGWVYFLEMDPDVISRFYVHTVAPDVELQARFGSTDLREQVGSIREEYRTLRDAETNPKKRVKLARQMEREIKTLEDLRDRLRGTQGKPDDSAGVTALRLARTANVLAQGGGFAWSSVPDLGMIVMRNGLWRTFRTGIVPLVTNLNALKLSAKELKQFGVALELIESRTGAMADMGDEFARNWLERGAQRLTRGFMRLNLLAGWNTVIKRLAGVITQTRMIEAIQSLQLGKIAARDAEDLIQAGIGPDMARRIAAMLESPNGMRSEGPIKWAQTGNWEDFEARQAFAAAMRNIVDQTIVTPGIADRPLLWSTELGKTITQYKSFAVTATQRVMLTGVQRRDAATLNGLAIMMALGFGVEWSKSKAAGRTKPYEPFEMLTSSLDRSGAVGIFGDFFNILERTGMLPFARGPLSSRYAARNTVSALLGPTVGLGESAISLAVASGKGEFTQSETRILRRLLPYQNLFYLRKLFDVAEENVNEYLGIPKTRSSR